MVAPLSSPANRQKAPSGNEPQQSKFVLPMPVNAAIKERETAQRPKNEPPSSPAKAEKIGDILRRAREKRGDTIQQVADSLCLRPSFVSALENSRYSEFPADAYVIGFLRSYAEHLGMNGQDAINYYRYEMAGRRNQPSLSLPIPMSEGQSPSWLILIVAAIAAIVVYAVWYGFSSTDRASVDVPPPASIADTVIAPHAVAETTPSEPVAQAPTPSIPATPAVVPATAPAAIHLPVPPPTEAVTAPVSSPAQTVAAKAVAAPHLVIRADQTSWVLIADANGRTVFDKVMKAGEAYTAPNASDLTLTTGNGSGITVVLDGVEQPKLSTTASHVIRNVPLSADGLKTAAPQVPD